MKDLLGGKGANLAEMANLGIPVPPGFTISTEVCAIYSENNQQLPKSLEKDMKEGISFIEKKMAAKFGDPENPLLVSVRSGARASMPGMMDTILNLGLNEETLKGLIERTGNDRFGYDAYRRFIQMYSDVVLEIDRENFEHLLDALKKSKGVKLDTDLTAGDLKGLCDKFKSLVENKLGRPFPDDPWEQLNGAIGAVFRSWNNKRAIEYRRINNIPAHWGTAVNVQAMVFGNMGDDCATGVAFTRDPSTGERRFFGEYLVNAQGEDVVAGIRTPQPINIFGKKSESEKSLEEIMPKIYSELEKIYQKLEKHYRDMQDIEFTIQQGKLWMLQTRNGKRTTGAAVRIATEMVKEGLISKDEAILRIEPAQLDQLLHPTFDPKAPKEVVAKGLPASPGAAVGRIVFSADHALEWSEKGEKVILVRIETSPDDIHGMNVAAGILTARGGMTCVAGSTKILTSLGFITAEEANDHFSKAGTFKILSYDCKKQRSVWRTVVATGKRKAVTRSISVSQTGRMGDNSVCITNDHKVYTVENRKLVKKPLKEIVDNGQYVCIPDKIPSLAMSGTANAETAYLAGAIFTDGCIRLSQRRGAVIFTQKPTKAKECFINEVARCHEKVFGMPFKAERLKRTSGYLRGRKIAGEAMDYMSFRKGYAEKLLAIRNNISGFILSLDDEGCWRFLAGAIDGDGSLNREACRINIYVSKDWLLQGIILACLRLGILPQVTTNRNIYNVQIVEQLDKLFLYTKRVSGDVNERIYGTKLFSARSLFMDRWKDMNADGKMGEIIKRNLLIDKEKVYRSYVPICNPKEELKAILESDFRMQRVKYNDNGKGRTELVYNFEVDAEEKLDKNFLIFTNRYTPVLISNSHAAVVARGMGKCCVAGCGEIQIDYSKKELRARDKVTFREGDWLSLNGSTGEVIAGKLATTQPELTGEFGVLMGWVDEIRRLKVRTNADTPRDAEVAKKFGAEGIGLCRTEHMFFEPDRIDVMREMIVADDVEARKKALKKLLPYQKGDFKGIFRVMNGLPVTVRLLDPPLHEFLPQKDSEINELAGKIGITPEKLRGKVSSLHEFNPMLGHRGCRLGVTYPEIYAMQTQAIMEAVCELKRDENINSLPEIEIPLVAHVNELKLLKAVSEKVAEEVISRTGVKVAYRIGTMIELVRAAITADEIAHFADFFSFGTNDLTQTTFGLSRDDAGRFLKEYVDKHVLSGDPFVTIDQGGVGKIMQIAIEKGRMTKPDLEIGICGEHGGEAQSVMFCHQIGLNYVSCSPYRVPIARLAAAQAVLKEKGVSGSETR